MSETSPEGTKATTAVEAPRWSREVVRAEVTGHPSLVYAERPRSVPELLVDARRWRGREHLVQGERRITFEAHESAVARVAQRLKENGVGQGDRVLLFGTNQIEWVVAFWAVQCLGGVAVLGNAWWSEAELHKLADSIQPRLALTDSPRPAGLPGSVPHLYFGDLRELASGNVDDSDEPGLEIPAISEDDPSIIIFSSGTTGDAKGVLLSHRSVVCNLQNLLVLTGRLPNELPESHPGTVSLLSVPLFHLAGIQVACSTLLTGGSLIFLEGRFDAGEVLRLIEKEKIRVWGSVPTMVSRVIDHQDFAHYDTSSLCSIPMGGANVSSELRDKVRKAFTGVRGGGGSLYGLTEAGGVLAAGSGSEMVKRPGCVGRPLPVVEVKIKDPSSEGVGEILARTPTAMSGYWGEESPPASGGWISTGDLGRLDEEGYLYVVGRSKDIIIRGGENIASGHVERFLSTHPSVKEAAVVPIPHPDLGEEVGAALLLHPGAKASTEEIKAHVAKNLARFEIPSRWWVRQESLPTNPTGKILRREVLKEWLERGGEDIID